MYWAQKFRKEVDAFLASEERSRIIELKPVRVYVRRGYRFLDTPQFTLDIASIDIEELYWRKGFCRNVFWVCSQAARKDNRILFVENVQNPILDAALTRWGLTPSPNRRTRCFHGYFVRYKRGEK